MPDFADIRNPPTSVRRARFLLEYLLLRSWTFGLRLLPRSAAIFWGTVLGSAAYVLFRTDRRVAMENLDIVFGDRRSIWFKREMALRSFQQTGQVVMGLLWGARLDRRSVRRFIDVDDLAATLDGVQRAGRGAIVVTPHYGDWELACIACGFAGYPMLSVAEPQANERIERLFAACRSVSGNGVVPPKFALLKLMRALNAGQRVAVLCDVNGRRGRGGVWNRFFGLDVFNGVAMAELAVRTGAAIVFVAVGPTDNGRHHARAMLVEPAVSGNRVADVKETDRRVTALVEKQVRREPAPWLWTYKRWKRRPTPEQGSYPSYSSYKRVD